MKDVHLKSWRLVLVNDSDGHLTVYISHADKTVPFDVGADIAADEEFAVRLTTPGIELNYLEEKCRYCGKVGTFSVCNDCPGEPEATL